MDWTDFAHDGQFERKSTLALFFSFTSMNKALSTIDWFTKPLPFVPMR